MPKRPLLFFPIPARIDNAKLTPAFAPRNPIPKKWQRSRVRDPLRAIKKELDDQTLRLRSSTDAAVAEEVLVLEVIGNVGDFASAVKKLGMEWLLTEDIADTSDDELREIEPRSANRLFAVATSAQAIAQLLRLWRLYERGEVLPKGSKAWKGVFDALREIRKWGPSDRVLGTGLDEVVARQVGAGSGTVRLAIELWQSSTESTRERRASNLRAACAKDGGRLINEYVHEATAFHGVIVDLPIESAARIVAQSADSAIVNDVSVMYCRPQPMAFVTVSEGETLDGVVPPDELPVSDVPSCALLDGVPVANHPLLGERITIDDSLGLESVTPVSARRHGTCMASLIVHGDLTEGGSALTSKLYVQPILQAAGTDSRETIPQDRFPQDVLESAVRRMFEASALRGATAPTVKVINLSIGDAGRPFSGSMSPWGRMIDYLSYKYGVLFVVSAGNHEQLEWTKTLTETEGLTADELQGEALVACERSIGTRRLLSPAESINALTVGAAATDGSVAPSAGAMTVEPVTDPDFPSPISARGPGFRRAVKPDVLMPGGRVRMSVLSASRLLARAHLAAPGQQAAYPPNVVVHTRGTSNAASLASRALAAIVDELRDDARKGYRSVPEEFLAVVAKALLCHSTSSARFAETMRALVDSQQATRRDLFWRRHVAPHSGFGVVNRARVYGSDDSRVQVVGWGSLRDGLAHRFTLPLPPSLSGVRVRRRLTVTLAWLSPTSPRSQTYRDARLWFSRPDVALVERTPLESSFRSGGNGTVHHEILEGEKIVAVQPGDLVNIDINCKSDTGRRLEGVKYGVAVSLEVAPEQGIPVFEEIRASLEEVLAQVDTQVQAR